MPYLLDSDWTFAWVWVWLPSGLSWSSLCLPFLLASISFSLSSSPGCGKGCFLQGWDWLLVSALPTFLCFNKPFSEVASCKKLLPCLSLSCSMKWFLVLLALSVASPVVLWYGFILPWRSHFCLLLWVLRMLCLLALRLFSCLLEFCGLSCGVACQLVVCCCSSSCCLGQSGWTCFGVGASVRVIQCCSLPFGLQDCRRLFFLWHRSTCF